MRRIIPLLLCTMMLAACVVVEPVEQPPPNCDNVPMAALPSIINQEIPPLQLKKWVMEAFELTEQEIYPWSSFGESDSLWGKNDAAYYARSTDSIIDAVGVIVDRFGSPPSLNEVIACLGSPDYYRAHYYTDPNRLNTLELILIFPDEGIFAIAWTFTDPREKEVPEINGSMGFYGFAVVSPGTVEEVVNAVNQYSGRDDMEQILRELQPWPGDWSDIVIGMTPEEPERSCDEISMTKLRPALNQEVQPGTLQQWIVETFEVPFDDISFYQNPDSGEQSFWWPNDDIIYQASVSNERINYVEVWYDKNAPAVDQIFACLGEPDFYRAWYHCCSGYGYVYNPLDFNLIFLDEGIYAQTALDKPFDENNPPYVDGEIRMAKLIITAPADSVEEMMQGIPDVKVWRGIEQLLQQLKPWPGSWDDVIVDVDPSLPQ